MQYRYLQRSGLKVSVLTMATTTFGGSGKIDNIAAASLLRSAGERQRPDDMSRPPLPYPNWHQSFTARDRLSKVDLDLVGPAAEEFKRG